MRLSGDGRHAVPPSRGAAPNAIAYGSKQFTSGDFFKTGVPASLLLMAVLALFVWLIWPAMGMPVLAP